MQIKFSLSTLKINFWKAEEHDQTHSIIAIIGAHLCQAGDGKSALGIWQESTSRSQFSYYIEEWREWSGQCRSWMQKNRYPVIFLEMEVTVTHWLQSENRALHGKQHNMRFHGRKRDKQPISYCTVTVSGLFRKILLKSEEQARSCTNLHLLWAWENSWGQCRFNLDR